MKINKPYILIRINKKERIDKQEKIGSIFLAPKFVAMERNMQVGKIVQIGSTAQQYYPEAQPGDTIYFDHGVESDPDRVLYTDEDGAEYRWIKCSKEEVANLNFEVLGIRKPDGVIIPAPQFIFCEKSSKPIKKQLIKSSLILVDDSVWEDEELLRQKLDSLQEQKKSIEETMQSTTDPKYFEEVEKRRNEIENERGRITTYLNHQRFISTKVLHIHPGTRRELDVIPGDSIITVNKTLYPLEVEGNSYFLAFTESVIGRFSREAVA